MLGAAGVASELRDIVEVSTGARVLKLDNLTLLCSLPAPHRPQQAALAMLRPNHSDRPAVVVTSF